MGGATGDFGSVVGKDRDHMVCLTGGHDAMESGVALPKAPSRAPPEYSPTTIKVAQKRPRVTVTMIEARVLPDIGYLRRDYLDIIAPRRRGTKTSTNHRANPFLLWSPPPGIRETSFVCLPVVWEGTIATCLREMTVAIACLMCYNLYRLGMKWFRRGGLAQSRKSRRLTALKRVQASANTRTNLAALPVAA